jgi:hypothetical protein
MDSFVHRIALSAASACLGLAALGAVSASAFTNSYCGVLISSGTWCGDGTHHSYNYNSASYTGAGSVWVCERLLIQGTTTERESPQCAYKFVDRTFASGYPYLTDAEVDHNTGANHTIYGYATA